MDSPTPTSMESKWPTAGLSVIYHALTSHRNQPTAETPIPANHTSAGSVILQRTCTTPSVRKRHAARSSPTRTTAAATPPQLAAYRQQPSSSETTNPGNAALATPQNRCCLHRGQSIVMLASTLLPLSLRRGLLASLPLLLLLLLKPSGSSSAPTAASLPFRITAVAVLLTPFW